MSTIRSELKVGYYLSYKKEDSISIGKIKSFDDNQIALDVYQYDSKETIAETLQRNDESIYVMAPGQKFDIRELHFPFMGKSKEEMRPYIGDLIRGKKTPLATFTVKSEDVKIPKEGKVMLVRNKHNGSVGAKFKERAEQLTIPSEIGKVPITEEMKEKLITERHLGLVSDMKTSNGVSYNGYVSIDEELNTVVVLPENLIRIPDNIKGVSLTKQDQDLLKAGEEIFVKDMLSAKQKKFDAYLRIDATTQAIKFRFENKQKKKKKEEKKENEQVATGGRRV